MRKILLLVLAAWAPASMAAYKCVDEKGIARFGETPPDECANVVMYEISRSGQVLKTIDPTPTAEQLKAREEAALKRKEAEKLAAEQNRKDQALLNSFASEREFDVARDRNIDPIKGRIKVTQERLAAVEKRMKEIEDELEFYKAGKKKAPTKSKDGKEKKTDDVTPQVLAYDHKRMTAEKAQLEKSLVDADKEIAAMHKKFDGDKQRWTELKSGGIKPKEEPKGPTTITLTAGAAGVAKCGDKVYECPSGNTYICREGRREYKVHCVVPNAGTAKPVSR